MSRILITGGFGFVGTHLVEQLLADDPSSSIHVVDNLSSNFVHVPSFLSRLSGSDRVSYDLCSVADYIRPDLDVRFDEIYHLASVVGPVGVLQHAGRITETIVSDTYRVANFALKAGARLCDVSTSEIYGGGREGYCSEKDAKIIPAKTSVRLEYAVAKLASEIALMNLTHVSDLQVVIIRPFNISGPRQSPKGGFVLPRFIGQALREEPITVYGDGSMVRAFTHVVDVVDGIIRAQRHGRRGEAYNIGNPENKTTILELAQRVIRVTASRSTVSFVDPKELFGPLFEEANDKYPDADKAREELGWRPRASIDDVIQETLEYIRAGRQD